MEILYFLTEHHRIIFILSEFRRRKERQSLALASFWARELWFGRARPCKARWRRFKMAVAIEGRHVKQDGGGLKWPRP